MKYKAILYDLDGTVLNTVDMNMRTLMRIIREELGVEYTFEQVCPFYAQSGMKTMDDLGIQNKLEVYNRWVRYVNEYPGGATVYPGFEEVLRRIHEAGILQGVASSKRRDQYGIDFVSRGLDAYVQAAVLEGETQLGKPHPMPLLECARRLGVRPEEALYVGDSPSDCVAAHAAGMDFAFAGWGIVAAEQIPQPEYVLQQPLELLKLAGAV